MDTSHAHLVTDIGTAATFVTAGKAIFTVKNTESGNHVTYRVEARKGQAGLFDVYAFTGTENSEKSSYTLLGYIENGSYTYRGLLMAAKELLDSATARNDKWLVDFCESIIKRLEAGRELTPGQDRVLRKNLTRSKIGTSGLDPKDPKAAGFAWVWRRLETETPLPAKVQFWTEGRCCCCGRLLTNPESIHDLVGPICKGRYGIDIQGDVEADA
jgi:hypothetical protein